MKNIIRNNGLVGVLVLLLAAFAASQWIIGCASVATGSSPFVVNVERVETVAPGAFDLVLGIDDSNRPYWRTNAPRFHAFAEQLRRPVPYMGTNYPASITALLQLQQVKTDYKAGRATSNALWSAFVIVNDLYTDATVWASAVTKPQ